MIYMFLADGFEETEALVTLDMLRRAGLPCKTVAVGTDMPSGAHGIVVKADMGTADIRKEDTDAIILPGGMPGTENLYADSVVISAVDYCINNNLTVAAICAAPIILGRKGLLDGKNAVCYPGFEQELHGANVLNKSVVTDENIITAKGAGCVFEFSHSIISRLCDSQTADRIISEIQHVGL